MMAQYHKGHFERVEEVISWPGVPKGTNPNYTPTGVPDTSCFRKGLAAPGSCGPGVCLDQPTEGREAGHCVCPKGRYGMSCEHKGSLARLSSQIVFMHAAISEFEEFGGKNNWPQT